MGLLQRFGLMTRRDFEREIATLKAQFLPYETWQLETADAERWNLPDPSTFGNQANLYRRLPAVFISVDVVSSAAALTEFSVARLIQGKEPKDIPGHDFEMLLQKPNPLDSRYEFLYATVAYWILNKNSYWWLNRADETAPPDEIWVIPPHMITPIPDNRMFLKGYLYYPGNGKEIFLPPEEIVHFKGFNPFSRFVGLSAGIESLMLLAQSYIGMTAWNAKLYNKSNGRLPGILSFKNQILDPQWTKIKEDTREAAENRDLLMLRGVGDQVNWQQAAATAKDMDFYTGMDKIDKMIMDVLAPGAYTMLFENANEANSRTGRATLDELAVYPKHVVMGQKITSGILPAYGSGLSRPLVGYFKDIRVTDRQLEITEQQEYAKTHTIAEIREEFYGDDPLGDERDELLPEQINAQSGGVQEPPTPLTPPVVPGQAQSGMTQEMSSAMNQPPTKAANSNSAMIALRIPDSIRQEIKDRYKFVDAETLNDLHITLVYLGDSRTLDKSAILRAVSDLGMYQAPIKGSLQGIARFVSGSETDPLVMTFDSPQMPKLYDTLCGMLGAYNVPFHREYGFIPHMTLAYIPKSARMPVNTIEPIEVNFSEVYYVDGGSWLPITLTGSENMAIKTRVESNELDALSKFERYALRMVGKPMKFDNPYLPDKVAKALLDELKDCTNELAVKQVFRRERDKLKPAVIATPTPKYSEDALKELASAMNNFASKMTATQTPSIHITNPAHTINVPETSPVYNFTIPEQATPNTYVNISPTVEAARTPDMQISSPVTIHQTVQPAEVAPVTINQTIEQPEAPTINVNVPEAVNNINVENKIPEQAAPVVNVENRVEPAPVKFAPTIETPAPNVTVVNEVKTPKIRRQRQKVERDEKQNIEGTTTEFEYDEE